MTSTEHRAQNSGTLRKFSNFLRRGSHHTSNSGNNLSPKSLDQIRTRGRAQSARGRKIKDDPDSERTVIKQKSVPTSNGADLDGFTFVNNDAKSNTLQMPNGDNHQLTQSHSLRMEFNPLSTPSPHDAISTESNTNINPLCHTEMHHDSLKDLMEDIETERININIDDSDSSYSDIFS